nr:transposase [Deinococcus sp. UR1]
MNGLCSPFNRSPYQYTSQRCNACGHTCRENRNNEVFRCVSCGHEDHADWNAAKNILGRAAPSGVNDSEVSHVVA